MKIKTSGSVLVDAPIERVFEAVEQHHVEVWTKAEYDLCFPDERDQNIRAGSRFVQVIRGMEQRPLTYTITAHKKPRHFGLRVEASHFTGKTEYRLTADAGGTRLEYSSDLSPTNVIARIFYWLTSFVVANRYRRKVAAGLAEFKELAEESIK